MKTVEIITVRLDPRGEGPLLRELRSALDAQRASGDGVAVELYRHATIGTDLSIHLRSESPSMRDLPSALGRRLAHALSEFGPTNHTTWIEEGT